MGPYCNMFLKKYVRSYQNCSELSKIDPFIGELPNEIWRARISLGLYQSLFIGFHQWAASGWDLVWRDHLGSVAKFFRKIWNADGIWQFCSFFEMAPYYNMFLKKSVRNYQNCSELFKFDPFIGELPNEIWRARISPGLYQGFTRASPWLVYRIP